MATHYHVLYGLQGCYMPDSNEVFATLEDARAYAAELAAEMGEFDPSVMLSADCYAVGEYSAITVEPCTEPDCCAEEGCAHESVTTPDGNGSYCRLCGETLE